MTQMCASNGAENCEASFVGFVQLYTGLIQEFFFHIYRTDVCKERRGQLRCLFFRFLVITQASFMSFF